MQLIFKEIRQKGRIMFSKSVTQLFVTLIIGTALGAGAAYLFIQKKDPTTGHRIALLFPAVHPSMDQIENGFIDTIKAQYPNARLDIFNANGNKTLMKGQAEEIVANDYDLAFAVGTNASRILKTTRDKKQVTLPLVFGALSEQMAEELVGENDDTAAVTDAHDRQEQVTLLLALKPVKKPLLIYDPVSNPSFERERKELTAAFKQRGIDLDVIEVYHPNELQQKVTGILSNYDCAITFTDHTLCSAMDGLIKLCNRFGVTLMTSELDSNDKGAVLSYGVEERDYGVAGAKKACNILNQKQSPAKVHIRNYYLRINTAALQQQNVTIDPLQLLLFDKTRINKGTDHA